jgi:GxxExxY protein
MNHTLNEIRRASAAVHTQLGPGLTKEAYETCLEHELRRRGLQVERGKTYPAVYKGLRLEDACRVDLLVEGAVLVLVKVEDEERKAQRAEMQNYLRWSGLDNGVVLNFNVRHLAHGWRPARSDGARRHQEGKPGGNRRNVLRANPLPTRHPVLGFPIEGGLMRRLQLQ